MKTKPYFLFFVLLVFTGSLFAQDKFTLVKKGEKAPDFTFEVSKETTKKLSDLKGKVVWINFFATWCGPCRKELPHLQKDVYEKYAGNENFELIILGREHSWDEVNKFKTDNKFVMPFYPDPDRAVFSKFAKQNIPRNFIIDKNGNIALASTGFNEKEFREIIAKVDQLLKDAVNQ